MNKILFLFVFTALIIAGCGKPANEVDPNYVGEWVAVTSDTEYRISIQSNSDGTYNKYKGATTTTATGKAKASSKKFYIGLQSFKLDQTPIYDATAGTYTMTLDGVQYFRL